MPSNDLLRIYLRDHHAAAVAAVELAKRTSKSNKATPFEELLDTATRESVEELRSLEKLMARVGVSPAKGKDASLWVAEKLGRLKLNGSLRSYSPLSRVVEFEGLALAARANRSVWASLRQIDDDRFDRAELERLEAASEDRQRRLEEAHREAVRIAFTAD